MRKEKDTKKEREVGVKNGEQGREEKKRRRRREDKKDE